MTKMRRMTAVLLFGLVTILFAGCGKSTKPTETTKSEKERTMEMFAAGFNKDGTLSEKGVTDCLKELKDYKDIKIPKELVKVSDKDVEEEIQAMLMEYSETKEVKKKKIREGDVVNLSYEVYVKGEPIEEEALDDRDIVIGSGIFEELEEGLIGKKPGDIEITFRLPDPYEPRPEYSGEEAVLHVKANYIARTKKPELTDGFVRDHYEDIYHVTTVKELKEKVKKQMALEKKGYYLMTEILSESKWDDVPESLIDQCVDRYVVQTKNRAASNGLDWRQYLKQAHYANEGAGLEPLLLECAAE